ncbi:MAG TPA: DUF2339 domain-containing protein [Myxococcaceae bacterium]|nr:DUF2339 domain-containing protein [Myxococcaceae bacterium]
MIRGWFTEGNVPVKVGVLVLLVGVAALLKYASDQGWLRITIGMRLAAITAIALGALGFAWRKRESHRNFALTVQGGAIGVLLLVVFAAFKLYGMLPAGAAFGLSVLLVAALGVLSVIQDARILAVLGIFSGFLAPIWLSTGAGNHVVLFAYYALLNAGIFGIAWMRSWRELNLMGWAFTWVIGTLWGASAYEPRHYATTQPFLALFFALYLLLPILSVRRETPGRRGFVNGSLVFGTPLIAFSLQAALFEGRERPLALCAVALALIYAGLWWWLRRKEHPLLGAAYGVLAASFATLAVPLALSARATSAVFALEGAGLIWLGLRQRRGGAQLAGAGLQLLAALAFISGAMEMGPSELIFANAKFAGALLVALAGFACAWWYRAERQDAAALLFYGWALAWWGGNVLHELGAHVVDLHQPDAILAFMALTALVVAETHRSRPAAVFPLTVLGLLAGAALMIFGQIGVREHPLGSSGAVAWLFFAVCGVRTLLSLRAGGGAAVPAVHFAWWLLWPLLAMVSLFEATEAWELGTGWQLAAAALPWLVLMALVLEAWRWVRWPLGEAFDRSRSALLGTCLTIIAFGWCFSLLARGASSPLPWVPLLNPLELTQVAALVLFARWLWTSLASQEAAAHRSTLLSLGIFVLVTNLTLRSVHHLGGVGWGEALWPSSLAQMSLTMVWSVLGVVAWIAGSKRAKRTLWMAGAVLMAVVLAKLALVDRHHLGDLLGIGSFFAYGLMCTLVGWFAPAPPRQGEGSEKTGEEKAA